MSTTVLRTIPCWACGHRIGPAAAQCPYCGQAPRAKRRIIATPTVARVAGRCGVCGGRVTRARGPIERLLARLGIKMRVAKHHTLACSTCGTRVTF